MNVRFLKVCLAEIEDALTWYETQSPELPSRILKEIADAVAKLTPFPDAFHLAVPPYRRILLSKFPYSLFFRVESSEVILVAFFPPALRPQEMAIPFEEQVNANHCLNHSAALFA